MFPTLLLYSALCTFCVYAAKYREYFMSYSLNNCILHLELDINENNGTQCESLIQLVFKTCGQFISRIIRISE